MKIKIEQSLLNDALQKAVRATSKNSTLPILQGVKLEVTDEGIIVTGGDNDSSLSFFLLKSQGIEIMEKGATVLPKNIPDLISKLSGELEISVEDTFCKIKTQRSEFEHPCWEADEYPRLPNIKFTPKLTLPGDAFASAVNKTIVATAEDFSRLAVIQGIHMKFDGDTFSMNGTDSLRFHRVEIKKLEGELFECTVPKKVLRDLERVNKSNDPIQIYVDNTLFVAKCGQMIYFSRLLEGTFPNIESIILKPSDFKMSIEFDRVELIEALEQMQVFARENNERASSFFYLEGLMGVLDTKAKKKGAASKGRIDLPYLAVKGDEDIKIRFVIDYAIDSLKAMTEEVVVLLLLSDLKPFMLIPKAENDSEIKVEYLSLISPMRHDI